jgi:hypothetical protein
MSCHYLVTKPSLVGVDADRISCFLRHPTAWGCRLDALSLWFGKLLPCLVAKPSFGGVTTLLDPHAATISPWTDAAWSNQPMWGTAKFTPSLPGGTKAPKAVGLALVEKV